MIVRLAGESDREAWNRLVAEAPNGDYRQLYEWGEIRSRTGWEPVRLQAENGTVRGIVQMLALRAPGTGLRLFYAPRGPVLADGAGVDVCKTLLDGASAEAAARGGILLRVDPEPPLSGMPIDEWLPSCGFRRLHQSWTYWNHSTYSLRIDLRRPLAEVLASFRRSKRWDIRKSERLGVQVAISKSRDDLLILHALTTNAGKRNRFSAHTLEYYETCWDQLLAPGRGYLFVARHERAPVAAILVVTSGRRAWALYGAPDPSLRRVYPYEAIFWGMIRELHQRGFDWLDVGPTANARPGVEGDTLYQFKMGFRPQVVILPGYYDRPLRPLAYRAWQLTENVVLPWAERTFKRCSSVVRSWAARPRTGTEKRRELPESSAQTRAHVSR